MTYIVLAWTLNTTQPTNQKLLQVVLYEKLAQKI